jgi:hypothetical protein
MSENKFTAIDYLMNAMERAAQAKNPAKAGYAAKRAALFREIRRLEESAKELNVERARIDWLQENAHHELKIEREHTSRFSLERWYRRYVSFHTWGGANLREAIDEARASAPLSVRHNDPKEK